MHPRHPADRADTPDGNLARRPRLLLAEDCPASRLLTAALLRGLGCEIETVADGGAAVTRASAGCFDLILLDIDMPVIDGIKAARLIRSRLGPAAPVIVALSGYSAGNCLRDTARTAFDAIIQKPTGRRELAALLALAGRPATHSSSG
jgi:CheY-like chemotaxis protein